MLLRCFLAGLSRQGESMRTQERNNECDCFAYNDDDCQGGQDYPGVSFLFNIMHFGSSRHTAVPSISPLSSLEKSGLSSTQHP